MSDELDRLARTAAPEVLAAALERARQQAVARLADLLTEAIVAQALAGPATPAPAPVEADGEPDGEALYAYGITPAGLPLPEEVQALTEGGRIEHVATGDLALLVSRVLPDDLRIDEDDLSETGRLATLARGHDAVVRAAAGAGPVLPLRFGTVVPDEAAARRLLEEHAGSARAQLRRIGENHEWGVKLVRRLDEPVVLGPRPVDRTGVSGTEYLARRRQALHEREYDERSAAGAADLLEESLAPHVSESRGRGGGPRAARLLDQAL
jgi:hypothetical protein